MFCLSITLQNIISGVFPLPLYWGAARPAHRPALAWLTEKRYSSWLYGADIGKFSCVPSWHQQTSDNSFLRAKQLILNFSQRTSAQKPRRTTKTVDPGETLYLIWWAALSEGCCLIKTCWRVYTAGWPTTRMTRVHYPFQYEGVGDDLCYRQTQHMIA